MSDAFGKKIESKRVSRKWQTMMDGFKKTLINMKTTGSSPTKISFYNEMLELLGEAMTSTLLPQDLKEGLLLIGQRSLTSSHQQRVMEHQAVKHPVHLHTPAK